MRTRKTVEPFRGKLPELIRRRYGKRRKLSEKELLVREAKGLEKRTFVNTRRKEIDAILSIYNHVITPDHFLLQLLGKEMRFKNYRVLLLEKFDLGMTYLRLKFPDDMSDSFRQDQTRMRKELEKLTDYLCELTTMKTPVDDRMRRLKKYVRKPMYTQRLVEQYSDLLERVFKILGIEVATKQKRNTAINLSYIQFSLPSTLESALNKSSKEDSEQYEVLKRAFLFSCLTGLRWSDIYKLKWKEVHFTNKGGRIHYYQKKTENLEYLDISEQALSYIGEKGKDEDNPFEGLKYSSYFNVALAQWMLKAGITKDIQ